MVVDTGCTEEVSHLNIFKIFPCTDLRHDLLHMSVDYNYGRHMLSVCSIQSAGTPLLIFHQFSNQQRTLQNIYASNSVGFSKRSRPPTTAYEPYQPGRQSACLLNYHV